MTRITTTTICHLGNVPCYVTLTENPNPALYGKPNFYKVEKDANLFKYYFKMERGEDEFREELKKLQAKINKPILDKLYNTDPSVLIEVDDERNDEEDDIDNQNDEQVYREMLEDWDAEEKRMDF